MAEPTDPSNPEPTPGGHGQVPPPGRPGPHDPPPGGYGPPPGQPGGYGPPPQPDAYASGGYPQAPVSRSEERVWAMLAHLVTIVAFFVPGLVVYLVFKDRSAYLRDQGREALNWGITVTVVEVIAYLLVGVSFGLLAFLPFLSFVLRLVFGILAGVAASRNEAYRYPFALRLVR